MQKGSAVAAGTVYVYEFEVPPLAKDSGGRPAKITEYAGYGSSEVRFEDGGQSMQISPGSGSDEEEDGMFVRLMSWVGGAAREDYAETHVALASLIGQRVRVTVEIVD